MLPQAFFLIFLILGQNVSSTSIQPLALIDDANSLLQALNDLVSGYISVANLKLWNHMFEVSSLRNNVELQGEFDLMEHDQRFTTQYTHMVEVLVTNKDNVTKCTDTINLVGLADEYFDQLEFCLESSKAQAEIIQDDGEYRVDVYKTNILMLQFQLDQCKTDETCLGSFIDRVKNQTIELPLRIEAETAKTDANVKSHEAAVTGCVTTNLKGYATAASNVIVELHACIYWN